MADFDPAFVQQILHISKRKWITHIHHNRQADDFGRRLEILEWVSFCHPATLGVRPPRLKTLSSDSAFVADLITKHKVDGLSVAPIVSNKWGPTTT